MQIATFEQALAALAAQDDRLTLLRAAPRRGCGSLPSSSWPPSVTSPASPTPSTWSATPGWVAASTIQAKHLAPVALPRLVAVTSAAALVEAAQAAANTHPHWQAELARLGPRLGRNKAIVAIARKLLIAVWHVLTEGCADCHAEPQRLARN